MEQIEKELESLEKRKKEITEKFGDTSLSSEKLDALSKEMGELMNGIDEIEMEWMEIVERSS